MLTAEQIRERRRGIGGSDAGAILGVSPYNTPLDIYWKKVAGPDGRYADEDGDLNNDNPYIEWGNRLEDVIRQAYIDHTGIDVVKPAEMFVSPRYPFMIANLDGLAADGRIVEIKTASNESHWGQNGDQVPDGYLAQVMHYMIVTGARVADIAVLIRGSDFRRYTVEYDPELAEYIVDVEADFWNNHVLAGVPPAPQSMDDVRKVAPVSEPASTIVASDDIADMVVELRRVRDQYREIEQAKRNLELQICAYMGVNETLLAPEGGVLATYKTSKGRLTLDSAALKAADPETFKRFAREGEPSRRFTVK